MRFNYLFWIGLVLFCGCFCKFELMIFLGFFMFVFFILGRFIDVDLFNNFFVDKCK